MTTRAWELTVGRQAGRQVDFATPKMNKGSFFKSSKD